LRKVSMLRLSGMMNQYATNDATPMEETDPNLVINPILVNKMKSEREAERKRKLKKGRSALGKSGGLAKLGLSIAPKIPKTADEERRVKMNQVDKYMGVGPPVADRVMDDVQRDKLMKKGEKAASKSNLLHEHSTGVADARNAARKAANMGMSEHL